MRTRASTRDTKKDVARVVEEINQDTYEVEEIIGSEVRSRKGRREKFYLVKFRDFSYEEADYYRASDIRKFCEKGDELIRKYEEKLANFAAAEAAAEKSRSGRKRSASQSLPLSPRVKSPKAKASLATGVFQASQMRESQVPFVDRYRSLLKNRTASAPVQAPPKTNSFFDDFANAYAPERKSLEDEESDPSEGTPGGGKRRKTSGVDSDAFSKFLQELSDTAAEAAEGTITYKTAWKRIASLARSVQERNETNLDSRKKGDDRYGFLDQLPVRPVRDDVQLMDISAKAWDELGAAAIGARAPARPSTPPAGPHSQSTAPAAQAGGARRGDLLADHKRFSEARISAWVRPEKQDVVVRLQWPDGTVEKVPSVELHRHPHCLYALARYYEQRIVEGAPEVPGRNPS
eukprot:scaffold752_cov322-Pavlova_lutheri.AAC.33